MMSIKHFCCAEVAQQSANWKVDGWNVTLGFYFLTCFVSLNLDRAHGNKMKHDILLEQQISKLDVWNITATKTERIRFNKILWTK